VFIYFRANVLYNTQCAIALFDRTKSPRVVAGVSFTEFPVPVSPGTPGKLSLLFPREIGREYREYNFT
jgi:hypothetical protein